MELVKQPLTEEELTTRRDRLANLIREKSLAEEKRKDAAATAKEEIDGMDNHIHAIAKEIREKCRLVNSQRKLPGVGDDGNVGALVRKMDASLKKQGVSMTMSTPHDGRSVTLGDPDARESPAPDGHRRPELKTVG